jgi:hypothetical protein
MTDRLRAKPPTVEVDSWTRCTVEDVTTGEGAVRVTVVPRTGAPVDLRLSQAQFDLFAGRVEGTGDAPQDTLGTTAWFR